MSTRLSIMLAVLLTSMAGAADPSPPALPAPGKLAEPLDEDLKETIRRLEAARKLPVPLPKTTPFDQDLKARQEYLTSYAESYRRILAEVLIGCNMQMLDGYQNARLAGIRDGDKQGQLDHPEHYRRMLGIDLPAPKPAK